MVEYTSGSVTTTATPLVPTRAASKTVCTGVAVVVFIGVKTMVQSKDAYTQQAHAEVNRKAVRGRHVPNHENICWVNGKDLPYIERLEIFVGDDLGRDGDKNAVPGNEDL